MANPKVQTSITSSPAAPSKVEESGPPDIDDKLWRTEMLLDSESKNWSWAELGAGHNIPRPDSASLPKLDEQDTTPVVHRENEGEGGLEEG
ncbi:uncharacterized protein VTP21DRAFT_3725 [Calcarisporiella thermophila]|uniref:uncharacterized protein n=1 Tax=Calcarisporiella thermophila TaxID=911321 RepID=UPI00374459AF